MRFTDPQQARAERRARLDLLAAQCLRLARYAVKAQAAGTLSPKKVTRVFMAMYRLELEITLTATTPIPVFKLGAHGLGSLHAARIDPEVPNELSEEDYQIVKRRVISRLPAGTKVIPDLNPITFVNPQERIFGYEYGPIDGEAWERLSEKLRPIIVEPAKVDLYWLNGKGEVLHKETGAEIVDVIPVWPAPDFTNALSHSVRVKLAYRHSTAYDRFMIRRSSHYQLLLSHTRAPVNHHRQRSKERELYPRRPGRLQKVLHP